MKKVDSLNKRYFAKLFSKSIKIILNLLMLGLIPRALGPINYGNFNFLKNLFSRVVQFSDFHFSDAFFTKFSKNRKELRIFSFRLYFFLFTAIILILSIILLSPYKETFLPGQNNRIILAVFIFIISQPLLKIFQDISDVVGYTKKFEFLSIIQHIFLVSSIVIAYRQSLLNINNYLSILIFWSAILIVIGSYLFFSESNFKLKDLYLKKFQIISYLKSFYSYTNPLVFLSLLTLVSTILDRWLLQKFYGPQEYGFFSLSENIGSQIFILSAAFLPLLQRELSVLLEKKDNDRISNLFNSYGNFLFVITSFICVFICFNSSLIIYLVAGNGYLNANKMLMIFSFYSIFRVKSQFYYVYLLANENTKLIRNYTAIFYIIGIPISFILVVPKSYFGFELGGFGLCIKLLIMQQLLIIFKMRIINEQLKISNLDIITKEITTIVIFSLAAWLVKYVIQFITIGETVYISASFIIYTAISLNVLLYMPKLFGLNPNILNFKKLKSLI